MKITISGRIAKIGELQSGVSKTGKQWVKKTLAIETIEQYPRVIAVDLFNEKVDFNAVVGEVVSADIDIDSREYNGKWYTSITAWNIYNGYPQNVTAPQQAPQAPQAQPAPQPQAPAPAQNGVDNLPF
ncbi:MAG: DUF3127 domain-containing protein [Muribaculaceae bacterium]|nr:DUF3127 domain-containing protein [Muribaculaceae bacterium]